MIRLASINQILDPWVYILLKKELLWRLISLVKTIFCKKSEKLHTCDHVPGAIRREPEANRYGEDISCLATCRGCLCDPPGGAGTYRNFSPSQTRRNDLCRSKDSLNIELTPIHATQRANGHVTEIASINQLSSPGSYLWRFCWLFTCLFFSIPWDYTLCLLFAILLMTDQILSILYPP